MIGYFVLGYYWCPKVASATSFFGDEKSNNRSF
jgi:hypothetical protein